MEDLQLTQPVRRASRDAIEEFKKSILWADMKEELLFWLDGFKDEQEGLADDAIENNKSTASVLMHLGDLNGRKKAVNYLLGMLDVFLSEFEERKESKDGRE
jgi:hypothetical protein